MAVSNIDDPFPTGDCACTGVAFGRGPLADCDTVVAVTADADPIANDTASPVASADRVAALDVLRGFALLGIFIMNMPGFAHSLFAAAAPETNSLDALVAALRDLLFAGKFNLLFGLLFGIGFALQMARLEGSGPARPWPPPASDPRARRPARLYARRLVFLLVVGIVHAMLLWPGDVLVVYAVLGFVLLALRRIDDRTLLGLIAACLLFPALAELARAVLFSITTETVAAFQYQEFETSNDLAFGHGSFLAAVLETARVFFWSYSTPLGLFAYAAYYVQMGTGILAGFLLGRHGWPGRAPIAAATLARAQWSALALALAATSIATVGADSAAATVGGHAAVFATALARTLGRAALAAFYAFTVLRLLHGRDVPRWLRPLERAGRMPLSNYLLQTLLASFVFYGWGLGLWGRVGPTVETLLAIGLFVGVQLPLSNWWLGRFRYGPLEYLWRRFTYGARVL
jgi:uncharacterized protein